MKDLYFRAQFYVKVQQICHGRYIRVRLLRVVQGAGGVGGGVLWHG